MSDQTRNTKDSVQVCSILHVAHVGVRRVTLVIVPQWSSRCCTCGNVVLRSHLFVNCCIGRYSIYNSYRMA